MSLDDIVGLDDPQEAAHRLFAMRGAFDQQPSVQVSAVARRVLDAMRQGWRNATDKADAARALRECIAIAEAAGLDDGDTATSFGIKALTLCPDDDELLLAYLSDVANHAYRYADANLLELASTPERRQFLALCEAMAEYFVHAGEYPHGIQQAFARARELGADEAAWRSARAQVLGKISFASVAEDLWSSVQR